MQEEEEQIKEAIFNGPSPSPTETSPLNPDLEETGPETSEEVQTNGEERSTGFEFTKPVNVSPEKRGPVSELPETPEKDEEPLLIRAKRRSLSNSPLVAVRGFLEKVGSEPEKVGSEPEKVGSEPEKVGSEPEKTGSEPEMTGSEPEMTGSEPEMTGSEPEKVEPELEKVGSEPEKVEPEPEKVGSEPDKVEQENVAVPENTERKEEREDDEVLEKGEKDTLCLLSSNLETIIEQATDSALLQLSNDDLASLLRRTVERQRQISEFLTRVTLLRATKSNI